MAKGTLIIQTKPRKRITISRDKNSGIVRIDEEACLIVEDILNNLKSEASVCSVISALIKYAVENSIIKEESEVEE